MLWVSLVWPYIFYLEPDQHTVLNELSQDILKFIFFTNLTIFCLKRMKIGPGRSISELVVDFLIKNDHFAIYVQNSDEIGPFWVIFDQTHYPTGPFIPPGMTYN
jgi:hypothetical protein